MNKIQDGWSESSWAPAEKGKGYFAYNDLDN